VLAKVSTVSYTTVRANTSSEGLPEDNLAFFVSDLIDQLDLSAIMAVYEDEDRGYPPYHPVMLTKVLVYGYCVGVFSSRKIQRRLVEDVAFRVLAAGNTPDFRTIAGFRKMHLAALKGFFEQVLRLARELGAARVGRVALDGSKIKANASKHKAMSYGRMREKQRQLRDEVTQLLAQAEAADAAEAAEYGADRHGEELPAELQRRESRLTRIRDAKRALEARAKEEAAAAGKPAESAKPDSKTRYNFTDPESRIMHTPDGFVVPGHFDWTAEGPFNRVANLAADAAQKFRKISPADVPPDLVARYLQITVSPVSPSACTSCPQLPQWRGTSERHRRAAANTLSSAPDSCDSPNLSPQRDERLSNFGSTLRRLRTLRDRAQPV
jgi:transposase